MTEQLKDKLGKSVVVEYVASNPRHVRHVIEGTAKQAFIDKLISKATIEVIDQFSIVDIVPVIPDNCEPHFTKKICVWEGTRSVVVVELGLATTAGDEFVFSHFPSPGTHHVTIRVEFLLDIVKYRYEAEHIPKDAHV